MSAEQVVLLRPCAMLHQRHPAPMQPLRYILPGWDLSPALCAHEAQEAARRLAARPADSLDPHWGFPAALFPEEPVPVAGRLDWQWYGYAAAAAAATAHLQPEPRQAKEGGGVAGDGKGGDGTGGDWDDGGSGAGEWRQRRWMMLLLARLRRHSAPERGI